MRVRDGRPDDAEAIARVARASWHAAYDGLLGAGTVDETVDRWYDTDSLRQEIAAAERESASTSGESIFFLVAEADDAVVGFGAAGPSPEGDDLPADAFISRLYVCPDRWGAGIGTALTGRLARRLQADSHERVWLEVFAENEVGRGFYESLGFKHMGSVDEEFGGTELTTLHLVAELSTVVNAERTAV